MRFTFAKYLSLCQEVFKHHILAQLQTACHGPMNFNSKKSENAQDFYATRDAHSKEVEMGCSLLKRLRHEMLPAYLCIYMQKPIIDLAGPHRSPKSRTALIETHLTALEVWEKICFPSQKMATKALQLRKRAKPHKFGTKCAFILFIHSLTLSAQTRLHMLH